MAVHDRGNLDWYLEGDAALAFLARKDLLQKPEGEQDMLSDPRIKALIDEVTAWPWPAISSHKSAGHPLHKFAFLAELGVDLGRAGGRNLLTDIESSMVDGLPRLPHRTPERYGGSGKNEMAWSLCDTPLMLYSMSRCFPSFDGKEGLNSILEISRENGMPCAVSPELGKFRGPGRKDDPCPLANLYTLRAVMQIDPEGYEDLARTITGSLLSLWADSRERHPYMFYMGTDFRKLKLPFVWYDILTVADALSHCPWVHLDQRYLDMLTVIDGKKDAEGRFKAESVWTSWKGYDFDQKKEPSRWVTFVVERLHRRAENVS